MRGISKFLVYSAIAVVVFYVAMFFFAESIPLPYGSLPDGMKIERMLAAEIIECALAAGDEGMVAGLAWGASKSDIARVAVDIMTRDQMLERRDVVCIGHERASHIRQTQAANRAGPLR